MLLCIEKRLDQKGRTWKISDSPSVESGLPAACKYGSARGKANIEGVTCVKRLRMLLGTRLSQIPQEVPDNPTEHMNNHLSKIWTPTPCPKLVPQVLRLTLAAYWSKYRDVML